MDLKDYPRNWRAISRDVRERAQGRCECEGECGREHGGRCAAKNRDVLSSGYWVVLTVAHLWRGPCAEHHAAQVKCGEPGHLKAMCQRCHLAYDLPHHIARRRRTRRARKATGDLFTPAPATPDVARATPRVPRP